jgi:hypothetical protein
LRSSRFYNVTIFHFFCLDGTIAWCIIDCPGSWNDALLFDRTRDFIATLPTGCWILGDSAFPRIPGRVERCRKRGEHLPDDPIRMSFQLNLESFCTRYRMSSEWGIKDV